MSGFQWFLAGSYGSAVAAYGLLALLLLTAWRGRVEGALMSLAALVSMIWGGFVVAYIDLGEGIGWLDSALSVSELLRVLAWLAFLLSLVLGRGRSSWFRSRVFLFVVLLSLVVAGSLIAPSSGSAKAVGMAGMMGLAILGLLLTEQLYRLTPLEQRYRVKYLCYATGGLFAYDFFLYSEALLYGRVDPSIWGARGLVNAFVVPLLAVAAARNPRWSVDIFISRSALFHSTAVIGSGIYLLVMAAGGYYIRYFGGDWGEIAQVAFIFVALLVLVILAFSDRLRARTKVFFSKHFYSFKYDYRHEWLRFTRALTEDEGARSLYQRLIRAMARIVDSHGGGLWVDDGGRRFILRARERGGQAVDESPCEDIEGDASLPVFLRRTGWLVDINEYRRSPASYEGLELPAGLLDDPDHWLIIPLTSDQRLLAILVLDQPVTPRSIDWEDCDVLKTAALQAATHLSQYESARALGEAREFEAFNQLSAFIIHDLKNLVAQLSLLLQNAERHADDPEFVKDMLVTVDNSVERMNRLLARLRSGRNRDGAAGVIDLARLVARVVEDKAGASPRPVLTGEPPEVYVVADGERLAMVIGHIVQNAIDATGADGRVAVSMRRDGGDVLVVIEDTGIGMSQEFIRDGLFRPFVSTKGEGNMGVGVYEARQLLRQLGGDIEVVSHEGEGTCFRLRIPIHSLDRSELTMAGGRA